MTPRLTTIWLVLEPANGEPIAAFDTEADAHRLAMRLSSERRFRYGVADMPLYDQLPEDWKERWRHA